MDADEKDLVCWLRSRGGVDLNTLARWHETTRSAVAACLPMNEFLQAWDELTTAERSALVATFLHKRDEYLDRARSILTPAELQRDKTYRRLRSMFPET